MKGKNFLLTIGFTLICLINNLLGANYYVLYNPSCMDRLLYVATTKNATTKKDTATEYLVYRLNPNVNERFYLEVGAESQQIQEFLPTQIYSCGNTLFDAKLVQAVNSGQDRVYLVVRKDNNRYSITQVSQVTYYMQVGQQVKYESQRYAFEIDLQRGIIGENIATSKRTEMYFEGKLENECNGAYLFTHRMPGEAKPHTDLVFVPEVGITELRNGVDAVDAWNNSLRLEKVNNYSLPEYLRVLCGKTTATPPVTSTPNTNPQLTERGGNVPQQYDRYNTSPSVSANLQNRSPIIGSNTPNTNNPCGIASGNGYHVVLKGETLYRISKLYNVTVSQIQAWNKLGNSTTISSCDRLAIAPPSTTGSVGQVQQPVQQGQGKISQQPPLVIDRTPAVNVPAPYDTYTNKGVQQYQQQQQQRVDNTTAAWKTATTDYHVVAPGETVASIALKYGYTEARFRGINNLNANEMVRIGQPLRITDCPTSTSSSTVKQPTDYNSTQLPQEFTTKSAYDFSDENRITPQFYMPSEYNTNQGNVGTNLSSELARRATTNTYDSTVPQGYDSQRSGVQVQRSVHLVKEGESLYRISQLYGLTVDRLRQLNNLGPNDVIIPYQRLYVN